MSTAPEPAAKRFTPLLTPEPGCTPAPKPDLSAEEQSKYDALLSLASSFDGITCEKEPTRSGPLTDDERAWLTRECLLRYLRAVKWSSAEDAAKRLKSTLAWRRDFFGTGPVGFTSEYIAPEQVTGKQWILGYDKEGRPCQYLNPGRQNTEPSPRQIHLFYMIERVVDLMPAGVETLSLLINFKPSKQRQNTSVPISTAREVLHILQNHYPERLGKALIAHVPWLVWGFFKLITPFIDPVTREKLKFNEDFRQFVPPAQLVKTDWNGDLDFDYDHDQYWPALAALCEEKRAEKVMRWKAAGGVVGESELYVAGGTDVSVGGFTYVPGEAKVEEKEKTETEKTEASEKTGTEEKTEIEEMTSIGEVAEKMAETKLDEAEKKPETATT